MESIRFLGEFAEGPVRQAGDTQLGESFGTKALGLVHLARMRAESPTPYQVPSSIFIPTQKADECSFNTALSRSNGVLPNDGDSWPIMIRSSHSDERPGQYDSQTVLFDPKNPNAFRTLYETYLGVYGGVPKGVVIQALSASVAPPNAWLMEFERFRNTSGLWGYYDRSFFLHSHADFDPRLLSVAAVVGLPHGIADNRENASVIDMDRESGAIRSVLCWDSNGLWNSRPGGFNDLRQENVTIFSRPSGELLIAGLPRDQHATAYLVHTLDGTRSDHFLSSPLLSGDKQGYNGIQKNYELLRLHALTQYFLAAYGQVFELEGNFVGKPESSLNCFQIREMSDTSLSSPFPLSTVPKSQILAHSSLAMGSICAKGRLVVVKGIPRHTTFQSEKASQANTLIRSLKDSLGDDQDFILLTDSGLDGRAFGELGQPSIRITYFPELLQSHSVGYTRDQIMRGERAFYGALFPTHSLFDETDHIGGFHRKCLALKPDMVRSLSEDCQIFVFDNASLESNGQAFQLFLKPDSRTPPSTL